ncbi:hypothetical protein IJJ08_00415 [bacterium]|nr:hypothetical protein [bacterium]
MAIDKTYLQNYFEQIVSEIKMGGQVNWRWRELRRHLFGEVTDPDLADEIATRKIAQFKQAGIVFVCGLVVAGMIALVMQSIFQSLNYWDEIRDKRQLLVQLEEKLSQLETAEKTYNTLESQKDIAVIDEAFPDYSDVGTALRLIGKVASEVIDANQDMVITSISVDNLPLDKPNTATINAGAGTNQLLQEHEVGISLSVTGSFQSIREFVSRLKNLRHNFRIEQLAFSSDETSGSNLLNTSIRLTYYYYN